MSTSRKYYDALAQSYPEVSLRRRNFLEAVDSFVIKTIKEVKPDTLLDVGSGDGRRIVRLTENSDIEVWALENSKEMCAILSKTISKARIIEKDISRISDVAAYFDVVTALWNVFGHIEAIAESFSDIKERLNSGGTFIFDVNNPFNVAEYGFRSSLRNWWKFYVRGETLVFNLNQHGIDTNVYFRSLGYYKAILAHAGFSNVDVKFVNYSTGKLVNRFRGQFYFECS